jgi:hypothetical protein
VSETERKRCFCVCVCVYASLDDHVHSCVCMCVCVCDENNLVALDEGQRREAIVDAFEVGLRERECVCVYVWRCFFVHL